jgi:hypothetical protein
VTSTCWIVFNTFSIVIYNLHCWKVTNNQRTLSRYYGSQFLSLILSNTQCIRGRFFRRDISSVTTKGLEQAVMNLHGIKRDTLSPFILLLCFRHEKKEISQLSHSHNGERHGYYRDLGTASSTNCGNCITSKRSALATLAVAGPGRTFV